MLIATGTVLVLFTWAACALVLVAMGMLPTLLAERGPVTWSTVRRALWWGLLVVALIASAMAIVVPLRSWALALVIVGGAVLGTVITVRARRRRGSTLRLTMSAGSMAGVIGLGAAVVAFAASALGPVTNYDSGLYHLGAITYAAEFPTIPGLANLYGPLGYGTSEFTLAAALGNTPFGDQGWRLLNGLIIAVAAIDLVLRMLRRRWSAGTFVLLVGLTVSLVPLLLTADYWVTSPSQDSAVFVGTVVASAYVVDGLTRTRQSAADLGAALAVATVLVMLRPTMAVYAAGVLTVAGARVWRARRTGTMRGWPRTAGVVVGGIAAAAVITAARDYLLSGWVLYPLSVWAFDVEWRAGDPTELRNATLGFWRDRDDIWGSVDGWAWVGPWLARSSQEWEAVMLAGLAILTGALLLITARATTLRWRPLLAALAPSILGTAAWWLASPPGFRFGWGPLVTLFAVPLGWALWRLRDHANGWTRALPGMAPVMSAVLIGGVSVVALAGHTPWSSFDREARAAVGPLSIPYAHAPVVEPITQDTVTESGLRLVAPVTTDQCWQVFPLCSPAASPTLRLRGQDLARGFLP